MEGTTQHEGSSKDVIEGTTQPEGHIDESRGQIWNLRKKPTKDISVIGSPFLQYYSYIKLVDQEQSSLFSTALESPLPITFRVNKNAAKREQMVSIIANEYPLFKRVEWLKSEHAYQLNADKLSIRKNPELKKYQTFLQDQDALGKISRQELVSMIPAALIDAQPNERILDMCAAPGSKTKQMLENMIGGKDSLLVANDISKKRSFMLAFQVLKLRSNCTVITSNDCTKYPKVLPFDKVLCDVPCSGDGTIRKQKNILNRWSSKLGKNLHCLQLSLLLRALYLVKNGGRVVYSTCSMNPMENEAVVSGALHLMKGFVKIVPNTQINFPGFKLTPILKKWPVVQHKLHNSYWDYETIDDVHGLKEKKIFATMFPLEDVKGCLRISPHENDTGGFFVAVLEKTHDFDENMVNQHIEHALKYYQTDEGSKALSQIQEASEETSGEGSQAGGEEEEDGSTASNSRLFDISKLVEFRSIPQAVEEVCGFYGFREDDKELFDSLRFVKLEGSEAMQKNIYSISPAIQNLLSSPTQALEKLQIVHVGMKVLETMTKTMQSEGKSYRILQEGVEMYLPRINQQRLRLTSVEEFTWLVNHLPKKFEELPESVRSSIQPLKAGIIVVSCNEDAVCTVWKGVNTLTVLLDKEEKKFVNFAARNKLIE